MAIREIENALRFDLHGQRSFHSLCTFQMLLTRGETRRMKLFAQPLSVSLIRFPPGVHESNDSVGSAFELMFAL